MLRIRKTASLAVLGQTLLFVLVSGCVRQAPMECDRYQSFFDVPVAEEESALRNYSLKEQVSICICGMYREPPALHLAFALAGNLIWPGVPIFPINPYIPSFPIGVPTGPLIRIPIDVFPFP